MEKWGKLSFLLAGLSIVVMVVVRYIIGGWIDMLFIPFATFFIGLILGTAIYFRTILEFLTMRTTKHGMNMGSLILLTLGLLFALNYLGVRFDKTFDFTEEKLNSLSQQSEDVVKGLTEDMNFYIFYKGEEAKNQQVSLKQNLSLYQEASPKIKVHSVNTYVDNDLALKFLNDLNDKNQGESFLFVEYKGKKVRVELAGPGQITEENVTAAMIRATREGEKHIYFITGHGERDLNGTDSDSISQLSESLEKASYKVSELNFAKTPSIPADADVLVLAGPVNPLLEGELDIIREYVRAGGHLLVAADPGQRHNVALLTKSLGVEFKNTFIFNQISQVVGRGMATSLGLEYDLGSEITNKFKNGEMTIFDLATEVIPAPGAPDLDATALIKTHEATFSLTEIVKEVSPSPEDMRPHTLAVLIQQKTAEPESKDPTKTQPSVKRSAVIVVGDSDFMANKSLFQGLNRDFILNSFAYLAQETDLVSIRPKQPKGTQMILTEYTQLGLVAAGVSLPLVLLILSGVFWYRRRGA